MRARWRWLCACVLPISVAVFSLTVSLVHARDIGARDIGAHDIGVHDIGVDAARQASQIDRLQAEQERLRKEQVLQRAVGAPDGARVTPPEMAASRQDETCVDVTKISVSGAKSGSSNRIAARGGAV